MAKREGQRHHLMFPRRLHVVMPETRRIRQHPSLIPEIHEEPHMALHALISAVPVPDYHMARRVARDYREGSDVMHSMDNLMFAYQEACQHPRAGDIERATGYIIIAAIEAQRPFIQEGLV